MLPLEAWCHDVEQGHDPQIGTHFLWDSGTTPCVPARLVAGWIERQSSHSATGRADWVVHQAKKISKGREGKKDVFYRSIQNHIHTMV
ncbi:hypothetical protein CEXT_742031 [Caerostris extrusa]|uniref:Uncharacterized protein n=1 Tax=Caerostris extrusa TaxID=172846 RepID=A0AAV4SNS5_CAEEX|nr:hypothetical protein CEXT_742031 [Caerostris extrusa]